MKEIGYERSDEEIEEGQVSLEDLYLSEAARKGKPVRLIFTTGYQAMAVIEDFDDVAIVAKVNGEQWLVYRNALSTVALGGGGKKHG